ncbi:hypothetical protein H9Q71_007708 [Fusarium xylarioides]|nr:hypothetical protein H9Q71_007708 [Fusarium xylarioides]
MAAEEDISKTHANNPDADYVPQEESDHDSDCMVTDSGPAKPDVAAKLKRVKEEPDSVKEAAFEAWYAKRNDDAGTREVDKDHKKLIADLEDVEEEPKQKKKSKGKKPITAPKEPEDEAETKEIKYLPSQHPWARKFRDTLNQGQPNFIFYLGALQLFGSERQLPSGILASLEKWYGGNTKHVNTERLAVLNSARAMAAQLGYAHAEFPAVADAKRVTGLVFIPPKNPKTGHAPGRRKGFKMGEIPKKAVRKRSSGGPSKLPAKRARKNNPSASAEDKEEDDNVGSGSNTDKQAETVIKQTEEDNELEHEEAEEN